MILTKQVGARFSHLEWIEYAKKNNLPQTFTAYRSSELGNILDLAKECALALNFADIDIDPRLVKTHRKAIEQGYEAYIEGSEVYVIKNCKCCKNSYAVNYYNREQSVCSLSCSNIYLNNTTNVNIRRKESINATYHNYANKNKKDKLDIYTKLKQALCREPLLKEWENECRTQKISFRLRTKNGFYSFSELKAAALQHNHRVQSVEYLGKDIVYNGTVDEFNNYYMGGWSNEKDGKRMAYDLQQKLWRNHLKS
jgi:hypothetical protein